MELSSGRVLTLYKKYLEAIGKFIIFFLNFCALKYLCLS